MKLNSSLLLASGMLVLSLQGVHAAVLMTPTNPAPGTPARNDFTGTIGYRFTVDSAVDLGGVGYSLSVTALGFQDDDLNGLVTSHEVGIWTEAGVLVGKATVAAGTADGLVGNYRYTTALFGADGITPVTSLTLDAGARYELGAFVTAGVGQDAFTDSHPADGYTMDSVATPGGQFAGDVLLGGSFGHQTTNGNGNDLRWAPGNMQFTVVPEPSAALLGGLGMLALLRRRRR